MKLIRFGEPGREKPGVLLEDGKRLDVSSAVTDYDEAFFGSGGIEKLRNGLMGTRRTARLWQRIRGWDRVLPGRPS